MKYGLLDQPEHIALLPDIVAAKYLTHSVLSGKELPPRLALLKASAPVKSAGARWDAKAVRVLFDEAKRRHEHERTAADAWLAPRLHATLRMTRREAAESGLWNFLAMVVAPDYVLWRHKGATQEGERATADRFVGIHYKQTFARLWWAAELFRDGDDYRPAVSACKNQDVLNTVLRFDIIDHRPAARALVTLLDQRLVRTGRDVNGLGQAVNAAGSTLMYDVLAPDTGPDFEARRFWIEEAENMGPMPLEGLPDGPNDGPVPADSVDCLVRLFEKLFSEAPVRGRKAAEAKAPSAAAGGVSLEKTYSVG
ncbi:DUF6339 family protein [Streptomyces sp. NBC_00083]|uniref:DUF6339 family protein n=1 Tax=Streptomyces sp. NBC_00083 TaxID=2975647 RepID=UPI00225210FC|nr:DUF6339 family protein [Streptomyces sp. NBC_00083]MCX5382222.1 DUF6339 family protein [Streptomyces sp. NBC_00083]